MLVEIEQERNLMYQDLVTQLEAQGALDKIDYFTYLIDDSINAKYFSARSNRAGEKTIYAPYGGWYTSDNSDVSMETRYYSVLATAAIRQQRNERLLTLTSVITAWIKPSTIINVITKTISVITGLMAVNAFIEDMYWSDITVGIDSAMIVAAYDKWDMKTTTVIWKWVNSPYMKVSEKDLVAYGTFTKAEDEAFIREIG